MKNWKTLLASILAIGMLAGCSKEIDGSQKDPIDTNDAVYMNVNIALPSAAGTRAGNGEEEGQESESHIAKILLVLARTDNSYVTHGIVDQLKVDGKATVTTTAKISSTEIKRFYKDDGTFDGDNKVNVFAICNPTQEIIDLIDAARENDKTWLDQIGRIESTGKNAGIWTDNYFLMTNSAIATKQFPSLFKEWEVKYSSETSPFLLSGDNQNGGGISNGGAIRVERVAARLDFKDGSPASTEANTYDIGLGDDAGKLQVRLVRMALVNMSKTFYYLRRVSDDGTDTGAELCGAETMDNYVVSTESEFKQKSFSATTSEGLTNIAALHDKFHFPLYSKTGTIDDNTRTQWDSYSIADVLKGGEDIDEGWEADNKTGYRIWRYVTENTLPGTDVQRTGLTTGVVFKGKLLVNSQMENDKKLQDAVDGNYTIPAKDGYTYQVDGKTYPILYLFQNQLYVGWNDEVTTAAAQNEKSDLAEAMKAKDEQGKSADDYYQELVAANQSNNQSRNQAAIDAALAAFRKAATAAGFTLYQASSDESEGAGYYFYYYYWNRHNDNGLPSTMGKMEFGVVRNNVYKLAVTGISKLGHPRITDNNPDPEHPDNPDEDGNVYLSVSVEVLPWTVRVNNIEF